jgi:predicted NACHT family NTPase
LRSLDLKKLPDDKQQAILAQAVRDHILDDLSRYEAGDFAGQMVDILHSGIFLLALDGLDEVPQDLLLRVRQSVSAVIRVYKPKRIIITCRVRSYATDSVLPQFDAYNLAPFNEQKIRAFVRAWYLAQKELGRIDAKQAEERTQDMAYAALSSDLRELSSNPMMLTTMAMIHQREIGLPSERVRLYNIAVDILTWRWQKSRIGESALII